MLISKDGFDKAIQLQLCILGIITAAEVQMCPSSQTGCTALLNLAFDAISWLYTKQG